VIADLAALYERRELLRDFAWRELRARYKGSALGFAWNFFIPLLQLVVFSILFGVLLRTPSRTATGDQPYPVFLFTGLVAWTFFASALQGGAASIVANGAIVKRVRMPVQLLPAASVLSALVNLLASLAVLLAVLAIFGPRHPEGLVWLPLLVAVELVLGLGFAYVLAALNVYFRDVEHILGVVLLAWYFLTPVLFPVALLAERPRQLALLYLNPMTSVVVGWQRALLDGAPPEWGPLAYTFSVALLLFAAGFAYFRRAKDGFEAAL
jgi:ABC-2 type transport system permease protein